MKKYLLALTAIVIVITVSLSSCEGVAEVLTSVGGSAVDARSSTLDGVEGVSVVFTRVGATGSLTATTTSAGAYTVNYTSEGLYEVTASKNGWFFIPQTVYIGGWLQQIPNLLGIELDPNTEIQDSAISFILSWNDTYMDLDGYLTFPNGDGTGYEGNHDPVNDNTFVGPYSAVPVGLGGFGPDVSGRREKVSPLNSSSLNTVADVLGSGSDSRPAVEIDRDDRDGNGPEVITVRALPFWPSTYLGSIYGLSADATNKLPATSGGSSVTWTWIGVMEYYIDGWHKTSATDNSRGTPDSSHYISATDGSGADAVLYVVQGSDLLGAFSVPQYANIRTANMIRINLFVGELAGGGYTSYLQFVPNIQTIDYADILSTDSASSQTFGVTGVGR